MGDVLPFTGEFYTRTRVSEDICEDIACSIAERLKDKYNFNTEDPEFLRNMAWLIKFIQVMVDDELGLANELSKDLKNA